MALYCSVFQLTFEIMEQMQQAGSRRRPGGHSEPTSAASHPDRLCTSRSSDSASRPPGGASPAAPARWRRRHRLTTSPKWP